MPSRDAAVIDGAVEDASSHKLPQNIAKLVFTAIINASISFELSIVRNWTSGTPTCRLFAYLFPKFDEFGAEC